MAESLFYYAGKTSGDWTPPNFTYGKGTRFETWQKIASWCVRAQKDENEFISMILTNNIDSRDIDSWGQNKTVGEALKLFRRFQSRANPSYFFTTHAQQQSSHSVNNLTIASKFTELFPVLLNKQLHKEKEERRNLKIFGCDEVPSMIFEKRAIRYSFTQYIGPKTIENTKKLDGDLPSLRDMGILYYDNMEMPIEMELRLKEWIKSQLLVHKMVNTKSHLLFNRRVNEYVSIYKFIQQAIRYRQKNHKKCSRNIGINPQAANISEDMRNLLAYEFRIRNVKARLEEMEKLGLISCLRSTLTGSKWCYSPNMKWSKHYWLKAPFLKGYFRVQDRNLRPKLFSQAESYLEGIVGNIGDLLIESLLEVFKEEKNKRLRRGALPYFSNYLLNFSSHNKNINTSSITLLLLSSTNSSYRKAGKRDNRVDKKPNG